MKDRRLSSCVLFLMAAAALFPRPTSADETTNPSESQVPAADTEDSQDLLFLGREGPVFLRLHIRNDGKSYQAVWNDFVGTLFTELDRDRDGALAGGETERIPVPQTRGRLRPAHMNRQQLAEFLRRANSGPFSMQTSRNTSAGVARAYESPQKTSREKRSLSPHRPKQRRPLVAARTEECRKNSA